MIRRVARLLLKMGGWKLVGELPDLDKAVFVAAPHTSNWDGFWLFAYKIALGIDVHFLAKHTLFWWPLGNFLRAMGATPIDRSVNASTVQQVVDECAKYDRYWFALSPEGTRKWQPYWKTGFYEIAIATNLPIVLFFVDYPSKTMGIGSTLPPPRHMERDLQAFREFYQPFQGRNPENKGAIGFPPNYEPSCAPD